MRPLLATLVAALAATALQGAIAELNPAEAIIESPDGLFRSQDMTLAKDFRMELIYLPNTQTEGQWVPMTWDSQGRLIVASYNSDILLRLTIPPVGSNAPVRSERIMTGIGAAEGLLEAFGGLYVNVNRSNTRRHGLYKLTDGNNDGEYDTINVIRNIQGNGDHGTHALRLSPDGRSIYLLSGNSTPPTEWQSMRMPQHLWGEDNLVLRIPTGFMDYSYAPQAWVANLDPNGQHFELFAGGMRNPVDFAFNKDGELFTYDADMEWDWGVPWYRPTQIQHITSGADFGFRNGSRKQPQYYFDYNGAVALIGSGSPVGTTFGTGAKFPARYQDAIFAADWSFGNLWAVMINPDGSSYTGYTTPFASGRPFAVSGLIVNPADGSLLVATTGTQLYRITYTGSEDTSPTTPDTRFAPERALRQSIERFHGRHDTTAVNIIWPYLADQDRTIRVAARTALEWQDVSTWRDRALSETNPRILMSAMVALARLNGLDEYMRPPGTPAPDRALQARMLAALDRIDWNGLSFQEKLDLLRTYSMTFIRMGAPDEATRQRLIAKFDPYLPSTQREMNWELGEMLAYLQAPSAPAKLMALLRTAPSAPYYSIPEYSNPQLRTRNNPGMTGPAGMWNSQLAKQEDEIMYAQLLRMVENGWTPELREEYFRWFPVAANSYRGGNTFQGSLQTMRIDAISNLPESERTRMAELIAQPMIPFGQQAGN
jgi:hypothetical protein